MTELDNAKHVIKSYITFVLIPAMCTLFLCVFRKQRYKNKGRKTNRQKHKIKNKQKFQN